MKTYKKGLFFALILALFFYSCVRYINHKFRLDYHDLNTMIHDPGTGTQPFLKAHLHNGDVVIFTGKWEMSEDKKFISGNAVVYNFNRYAMDSLHAPLPVDSIAIYETNRQIEPADGISAIGILTGVDVIMSIICLTNPKACFGSCPTFYYKNNENIHAADAEGFSSSILPSLEASDIDDLNCEIISNGKFQLLMKNEALETHAVNDVQLLAFPIEKGTVVKQDQLDNFYRCKNSGSLLHAEAEDKSITEFLKKSDHSEWFNTSDSNDLWKRTNVELTFQNTDHESKALALDFRQTLLSTFLIYEALSYMGDEVSDVAAAIESTPAKQDQLKKLFNSMCNINITCWSEKNKYWLNCGNFSETGPIAINKQIIILPDECKKQREIKIKISGVKGMWRYDFAELLTVLGKAEPLVLSPCQVLNKKGLVSDSAKQLLSRDDNDYLTTMPGDYYTLEYALPAKVNYNLFLKSKGYYLEWMRSSWLKSKNLARLNWLLDRDEQVWHSLAKDYKKAEPLMENIFWSSKIEL